MTAEAKGPQYAIVPPSSSSPLPKAVDQVLKLCLGYEKAKDFSEASLIIVDSIENYGPKQEIDRDHLAFYRHSLGGKTKTVLYLGSFRQAIHKACPTVPWVYGLPDNNYALAPILGWIDRNDGTKCDGTQLPAAEKFGELLVGEKKDPKLEQSLRERGVPEDLFSLVTLGDLAAFYFALVSLTANHEHILHEAERVLGSADFDGGSNETVGRNYRRKQFLTDCNSLRRSLAVAHKLREWRDTSILLIDDQASWGDPAGLETAHKFSSILSAFFPKHKIVIWDPFKDAKNHRAFLYLRRYQSLGNPPRKKNISRITVERKNKKPKTLSLSEILMKSKFLLVDMLFDKEFLGPEIIRGISRLVRDLEVEPGKHIPEIIAVSRTPDPGRIQEALQAGARSYVLKSDLLELPAVLSGITSPISEQPHTLQRNFRRLYQLPNDVRGLIHDLKIPRADWHKWHDWDMSHRTAKPRYIEEVAKILEAIPKADLHVHIGSCMEPEFLVLASIVGLVSYQPSRNKFEKESNKEFLEFSKKFREVVDHVTRAKVERTPKPNKIVDVTPVGKCLRISVEAKQPYYLRDLKEEAKDTLLRYLKDFEREGSGQNNEDNAYRLLRSYLHQDLKIRDELNIGQVEEALRRKPAIEIAWFFVKHEVGEPQWLDYPTFVRLFLLCIAATKDKRPQLTGKSQLRVNEVMPLKWFQFGGPSPEKDDWNKLRQLFYEEREAGPTQRTQAHYWWRMKDFRKRSWRMPDASEKAKCPVQLKLGPTSSHQIRLALASGERSRNLDEYLEGCEFSGAIHLQHPFLIHLYAQHIMPILIKKGVIYAELRGSPDGYENLDIGFDFASVCRCLVEAFDRAQATVVEQFKEASQHNVQLQETTKAKPPQTPGWLPKKIFKSGGTTWALEEVFKREDSLKTPDNRAANSKPICPFGAKYPVKIGLLFVGKRHKTKNEMILEAAAAAVFKGRKEASAGDGQEPFLDFMKKCRVVGFDLAGPERGFAPSLFAQEFQRLSKLHIPLTVHAGENAPAQFVEDAILELGASRIGHGLALAEDKKLMARVRDERVCIELCPVSNHQTGCFVQRGQPGREYPLRKYMEAGIPVCLNTDNPIISRTDIVKEFFQASWAWESEKTSAKGEGTEEHHVNSGRGMPLWEALRLVRLGFRHAFLPLPERRMILEAVDQILFDLFSCPEVKVYLRDVLEQCELQARRDSSQPEDGAQKATLQLSPPRQCS